MEDIQFNKIRIIGAGGLGREIASQIIKSSNFCKNYFIEGFYDDNSTKLNGFKNYPKILGPLKSIIDEKDEIKIILAINDICLRESIHTLCSPAENIDILGFISEKSSIGLNCSLHQSVTLMPNTIVTCDIEIEEGVFVNCGSQIGHDAKIGKFSAIMSNVDIGGECEIGQRVFIGSGATILPRVKIVDECIIGAGAVVFKNIKEKGTYVGNPAIKVF